MLILHSVELIGLMKISSTEWLFVNAWNGLKDQRTNHALTFWFKGWVGLRLGLGLREGLRVPLRLSPSLKV